MRSRTGAITTTLIVFMIAMSGWYFLSSQNSSRLNLFTSESQISERELLIQEKLHESNIIWQRSLFDREKAEKESNTTNVPWKNVRLRTIWDFFYPTFNCPHSVERVGRVGDGGKWTCGIGQFGKRAEPCVTYSYGVSLDSSFEEEILRRTNCVVYAYDHTVDEDKVKISKLYPTRSWFFKLGLGVKDNEKLRTLKSEMERHHHKFIDILKIDIEGGEYKVLTQILADFPNHLPVGQLLIELHIGSFGKGDELYKNVKKWMESLENAGLRPFMSEANLIGGRNCFEFSFLNVGVDHPVLHA